MIVKSNAITAYLIDQWKQNSLSAKQDIIALTTTDEKPIPLFYANDCNGYMGYYLTQANLHEQFSKQKVTRLFFQIHNEIVPFPAHSYEAFFQELTRRYSSEADGLSALQTIMQHVGQEWFEFIIGGMDWQKFMALRYTLKYADMNFMEVVDKHISNPELRELFTLLQPYVGDVGFNTMAGYLYKQLFDMHKMPHFWMSAHHYSGSHETKPQAAEICTFVDEDYMQSMDVTYTYYSLVFRSSDLKLDSVLFTKIQMVDEAFNLMLWPYDFVETDAKMLFKLDVSIPQDFTSFEALQQGLVQKLQNFTTDFKIHNIYTPDDYQRGYGFAQGTGTRWALSAQQAKKLSNKLMNKYHYNHWGYAWFTSIAIFINYWRKEAGQE